MSNERGGNGDDRRTDGRSRDAERGLPRPLVDVIADPAKGRQRLPYLLGLLDSDDAEERLTAGTAVALVVEEYPDMLGYAVRRLVDRLGDDAPVEVAHALDYLAARRPKAVDGTVADLDDAAQRTARERMYRTGAGFARNEYLAGTNSDRPVGRTRVAGDATATDPRRVRVRDPDDADHPNSDEEDGEDEPSGDGDRSSESDQSGGGDGNDGDAADIVGDDADRGVTSGTLALVSKRLSAVVAESRFDELNVLTDRQRGRHGDVYRAAAALDGEERGVALTVYHLPDDGRRAFVRGFRAAMSGWADADDHENVQTVSDWGVQPRPWAALEYAGSRLADRGGDLSDPLSVAVDLAGAVGHAHQHGVIHGAVDPGNVAFVDTALTEGAYRRPLLTNVGLATAIGTCDPGTGVDPRYAAPEHYDDRFGRIDNATDVYGLGVLLYRLCTGEHPYYGDPETVRDAVVADRSPAPIDADPDLPAALDQVVRKATATRKLTRYETVNHLERELRTIRDGA